MTNDKVRGAIRTMFADLTADDIHEAVGDTPFKREEFEDLCGGLWEKVREQAKRTVGFDDEAQHEITRDFDANCSPDLYRITGDKIEAVTRALIDKYAPLAGQHQDKMVETVEKDDVGHLDLVGFTRLVRLAMDIEEVTRHQMKEYGAIENTKFVSQEVEEFREIFATRRLNEQNLMPFGEVLSIISSIIPMKREDGTQLMTAFKKITSQDSIDFSEFLMLMHHLMEINFLGIKEMSEEVAQTLDTQKRPTMTKQPSMKNLGRASVLMTKNLSFVVRSKDVTKPPHATPRSSSFQSWAG